MFLKRKYFVKDKKSDLIELKQQLLQNEYIWNNIYIQINRINTQYNVIHSTNCKTNSHSNFRVIKYTEKTEKVLIYSKRTMNKKQKRKTIK